MPPTGASASSSVLRIDEVRRHFGGGGLIDEEHRAATPLGTRGRHARIAGAGEGEPESGCLVRTGENEPHALRGVDHGPGEGDALRWWLGGVAHRECHAI